jgi:myosin heavy subunit
MHTRARARTNADFFLSVPIVKTKRKYNDLVDEYLKKIKDPANKDDREKQELELVHLYQVQKENHRDQLQSILDSWAKLPEPHPKAVEYQDKIHKVNEVLEDKAELRRRALECKRHYQDYEKATDEIGTIERRLHNMDKNDPGYADEEARMKTFKKEAKKYKQHATKELTEHVLSKVFPPHCCAFDRACMGSRCKLLMFLPVHVGRG